MATKTIIDGETFVLPIDDEVGEVYGLSPAMDSLHGKVIGFLNNSKDNVDHLFVAIEAQLQAVWKPRRVVHRVKERFSVPAPTAMLQELHAECDAVIVAAGCCGSCTACSIDDGVHLERMGTPAVTICTEGFRVAGQMQAKSLGMPEHRIAIIAHPLGTMPRDEIGRQAARAWSQIGGHLLAG